nr:hypothetical protein [Achromobacter sp. Marseille-Q4962]
MRRRAGHAPGQGGGIRDAVADIRPARAPVHTAAHCRGPRPALGPHPGPRGLGCVNPRRADTP